MPNLNEQLAACDCLFIGGSTDWKITVGLDVADAARSGGAWTHMGRVNTAERYRLACARLIDSADGTFLGFGPDANLPRLTRWLDAGAQLALTDG